MSKKPTIWTLIGAFGMLIGLVGTAVQNYAGDKELDERIDERIDKKLAESQKAEEQ